MALVVIPATLCRFVAMAGFRESLAEQDRGWMPRCQITATGPFEQMRDG
jgi:hypothetical protein